MAVILQDDFQRPDGAVGSPVVGGPYTVVAGTWAIQGGALRTSASLANAYMTFPAVRDIDITWVDRNMSGASGMVFRWVDVNNHWLLYQPVGTGATWTLARRVAGNYITFWTGEVADATDVVRVICSGRFIYVLINGKLQGAVEDGFHAAAAANSAAGFWINSDTTQHMDDVLAQDTNTAVVPGGYDGGQASVLLDQRTPTARTTGMNIYKGRNTADDDTPEVA